MLKLTAKSSRGEFYVLIRKWMGMHSNVRGPLHHEYSEMTCRTRYAHDGFSLDNCFV